MKTSNFWDNSTIVRLLGEALCSWRYRMGSGFNFDRFTDRFLMPVDKYADLIICAKQCNKYCGFRKILRRRDGTFEAYCPENPADGFVIDQQEVLLYNIKESTLVEEISRSLNITPYMAKLANHEHSWKVGNIIVRGESHSVFFTLQWDTELLELILELNRLMHNPYVLLGSTERMYNNVVAGCLANGDAVFIPLNETLDFNADAELEQMRPFSWEKMLLPPEALNEEPENIFRKCGDAWEVRFAGGEKFMLTGADTGARYIHFMLGKPNETTLIIDIMHHFSRFADGYQIDDLVNTEGTLDGFNLTDLPIGGFNEIADDAAIKQYRAEAKLLMSDITNARANGDNVMLEQLEQDLERVTRAIYDALGPKGQKKKMADQVKRFVDAFRRTVNFAIEKINVHDPHLASHLKETIRHGQTPGYIPGKHIVWDL